MFHFSTLLSETFELHESPEIIFFYIEFKNVLDNRYLCWFEMFKKTMDHTIYGISSNSQHYKH